MLITTEVETAMIARLRPYYESLGYIGIKERSKFICKVKDLLSGSKTKISYRCDYCGKIIDTSYQNYLRYNNREGDDKCNSCSNKLDFAVVKQLFEDTGYTLISTEEDYKHSYSKLKYLCPTHGLMTLTYSNLQQGVRCRECSSDKSKGEKFIKEYLDVHNITHSREYTFDNLITDLGRKPRFDFAIFDTNNRLKLLIEYNGAQHYKSVERFGGEEFFKRRQELDVLKINYCNQNNIPLLVIPYTEFKNLDRILNENLEECKNVKQR